MIDTKDIRLVSQYTGLNFNEVIELDCFTYKRLLKDAFVEKLSSTEEGREYLENCWILKQTNPDTKSLREYFKEN